MASKPKRPDPDVSEATTALKNLLGIGGGGSAKGIVEGRNTNASTVASNKQGKKNKNATRKQERKQQRLSSVESFEHANAKSNHAGDKPRPTTSGATTPKQQRPPVASRTKSEKGVVKVPESLSTPTTSTSATEHSKFAFSAFQASPDASMLPIPVFHSANDGNAPNNNVSTPLVPPNPQDNEPLVNASALLEDGILASTAPSTERALQPKNIDEDLLTAVKEDKHEEVSSPPTTTGINLAFLESSSRSQKKEPPPEHSTAAATFDPIAALLNTNSSCLPPTSTSHPAAFHAMLPPPPYSGIVPPPIVPPYNNSGTQYITIPVQIPPNLPPNRVIIVEAPPPVQSFPIYIQVPQHITPGMVIPVQVPVVLDHIEQKHYHQPYPHSTMIRPPQQQQMYTGNPPIVSNGYPPVAASGSTNPTLSYASVLARHGGNEKP